MTFTRNIILVTYNSEPEIEKTISTLRPSDFKIWVVDNASKDGTLSILSKLQQSGAIDHLILNDGNYGFAKGVNVALQQIDGHSLLLNPDAQISIENANGLFEALDSDNTLGIVAPVVSSGPEVSVMAAGKQPRLWPMFTHLSGIARALPRVRRLEGRHLYLKAHSLVDREVEWVSGCCLAISADLLKTAGPLSEQWFMYGEDVEYCLRASQLGYRIKVLSSLLATHEVGASVNRDPGSVSTMWAENLYDFYCRNLSKNAVDQALWRIQFSFFMLLRAARYRLLAYGNPAQRDALRARATKFNSNALAVWTRSKQSQ